MFGIPEFVSCGVTYRSYNGGVIEYIPSADTHKLNPQAQVVDPAYAGLRPGACRHREVASATKRSSLAASLGAPRGVRASRLPPRAVRAGRSRAGLQRGRSLPLPA